MVDIGFTAIYLATARKFPIGSYAKPCEPLGLGLKDKL